MSVYTYNPNNLAAYGTDWVRFQVEDSDPNNWLLADQEIAMCLASERDHWGGAAQACEVIARQMLKKADVKLGRSMQVIWTKAAQNYIAMAKELRRKSLGTVAPYFGGVNITDKIAIATNAALSQPAVTRGMQQNPWVGGYTPDTVQLSPGGVAEEAYPSPSAFA